MLEQGAHERRVNAIWRARAGPKQPRWHQIVAVMKVKIDAVGKLGFRARPPWLIMAKRMNGDGAGLIRQFCDLVRRPAPAQDQPRPFLPQGFVKTDEAMMKPPARRGAHSPLTGAMIIENIDGNDWPGLTSGKQGCLISDAQIAAKPENHGIGHQTVWSSEPRRIAQ